MIAPSGTIRLQGTATYATLVPSTGGGILQGTTTSSAKYNINTRSGLISSGTAVINVLNATSYIGGCSISGSSDNKVIVTRTGSGGIVAAGFCFIEAGILARGGIFIQGTSLHDGSFHVPMATSGVAIGGLASVESILSRLRSSPFVIYGTPVNSRSGCRGNVTLSQSSFLSLVDQNSRLRQILESISRDDWNVASFDKNTRIACVEIWNGDRMNVISTVLEPLTIKQIGN